MFYMLLIVIVDLWNVNKISYHITVFSHLIFVNTSSKCILESHRTVVLMAILKTFTFYNNFG